MNTKSKGNICVGAVIARLIKSGKTILVPLGDNERYDLVLEKNGKFERIQCKLGKLKNGAIVFASCSSNLESGKWIKHTYNGEVEFFGVYCPELDKIYLVPIGDVENNKTHVNLRLEPPKNGQAKKIRLAKNYELQA